MQNVLMYYINLYGFQSKRRKNNPHSLTHAHTHTHSSLTLTFTLTLTHSLSFSLTHTHTQTRTRTRSHSHTHSLSHSRSHTLPLSLRDLPACFLVRFFPNAFPVSLFTTYDCIYTDSFSLTFSPSASWMQTTLFDHGWISKSASGHSGNAPAPSTYHLDDHPARGSMVSSSSSTSPALPATPSSWIAPQCFT